MPEEKVTLQQFIAALDALGNDLIAAKAQLIELDSAMGDGDLGITVERGMKAVQAGLASPAPDIGRILVKAGMDFSNNAPSTMGALLGTAFMRAGKAVQGQSELSLADVARMFKAAEDGIRERGKAQVGDKTMLDALTPARASLEEAVAGGASLAVAFDQAKAAAEQGVESTVNMVAAYGRGRWLGERTIGHADPGASLVVLIIDSFRSSAAG